jgi:hypothetical protein
VLRRLVGDPELRPVHRQPSNDGPVVALDAILLDRAERLLVESDGSRAPRTESVAVMDVAKRPAPGARPLIVVTPLYRRLASETGPPPCS